MKPMLFLEERVELVRESLNRHTMVFNNALPESLRSEFKSYVHDLMTILEGDFFREARKRIKERK